MTRCLSSDSGSLQEELEGLVLLVEKVLDLADEAMFCSQVLSETARTTSARGMDRRQRIYRVASDVMTLPRK